MNYILIYFTFCPILSYICLKFQQSGGGGGRLSNFKLFMSKASVICAGGGGGRLPCFKLYMPEVSVICAGGGGGRLCGMSGSQEQPSLY